MSESGQTVYHRLSKANRPERNTHRAALSKSVVRNSLSHTSNRTFWTSRAYRRAWQTGQHRLSISGKPPYCLHCYSSLNWQYSWMSVDARHGWRYRMKGWRTVSYLPSRHWRSPTLYRSTKYSCPSGFHCRMHAAQTIPIQRPTASTPRHDAPALFSSRTKRRRRTKNPPWAEWSSDFRPLPSAI